METVEYKGYTINILQDDYPESPREWDNFGKLALFHKRYDLPNDDNISLSDAHDIWNNKNYIVMPVWGYDHGQLWIKASWYRDYPFNDYWDAGQLGITYISKEDVRKEYNVKRISQKLRKKVIELLKGEVEVYNNYITGNVWGYQIVNPNDEEIDSCWGFYGDDFTDLLSEAKLTIDYDIKQCEKEEDYLISRTFI